MEKREKSAESNELILKIFKFHFRVEIVFWKL